MPNEHKHKNSILSWIRQFLSFTRKEFIHILRDSRTILILVVMPIVLITLFGYAISTEVRGAHVTICDEYQKPETRLLPLAVNENKYFHLVSASHNMAEIEQRLEEGSADAAIYIDHDGNVLILCDGSEPNQAQMRANYLQQIIQDTFGESEKRVINVESRSLFNPQQLSEYNFVPGVIAMVILLICAMMTSIAIVREKENGTMELLLASPLSPFIIIVSKLVPYFIVSSLNLITILLLSYYLLGVPIAGSLLGFVVITLLYIIVSLALGLLISAVANSQMTALLFSILLIVPTVYLSGFVFAFEAMPKAIQVISTIVPTRWYIDAARRLLIQGVEVHYVAKDAIILGFMAVILMFISIKLFKKRLA